MSHGQNSINVVPDRYHLAGGIVSGMFWGIHLVFFSLCVSSMLKMTASGSTSRTSRTWFFLAFVVVMFVAGTLNFIGTWAISQEDFVDNRLFPAGPSVYSGIHFGRAEAKMRSFAYIVANILADGLMLYRTFIVWNKNYLLIVLPSLHLLATAALAVLAIWATAQPGATFYIHSFNFLLAYFTVSISLNVVLTLLIAGRLLWLSSCIKHTYGNQHAKKYTSVAAMLVECALPYSAVGLAFTISYVPNHPVQEPLIAALSQLVCISPELIIWRAAMGRAWAGSVSAMASQRSTRSVNGSGAAVELHPIRLNRDDTEKITYTTDSPNAPMRHSKFVEV